MKIELAIEWETHRAIEMRGPQNGDSAGDYLEGQA